MIEGDVLHSTGPIGHDDIGSLSVGKESQKVLHRDFLRNIHLNLRYTRAAWAATGKHRSQAFVALMSVISPTRRTAAPTTGLNTGADAHVPFAVPSSCHSAWASRREATLLPIPSDSRIRPKTTPFCFFNALTYSPLNRKAIAVSSSCRSRLP